MSNQAAVQQLMAKLGDTFAETLMSPDGTREERQELERKLMEACKAIITEHQLNCQPFELAMAYAMTLERAALEDA